MNTIPIFPLVWSCALALLSVAFAARAETRLVQDVAGKKASLALLEREMKHPSGQFCGAKRWKLVVEVDEQGAVTFDRKRERELAEDRVLELARSLRGNRSVAVLYCEVIGEDVLVTATSVTHVVWKKKDDWTASLVMTGKSVVAAQPSASEKMTDAEVSEALAEASREANKSLPIMLDKDTRLDNTVGAGGVFLYNYTLVAHKASALDAADFQRAMKAGMARGACEDKGTRFFLENGVRFEYRYHGKDGKELTTISVSSADCE